MNKRLLPLLMAAAMFLSACDDRDDVREPTPLRISEIVTYAGQTTQGTAFLGQRTDGSEVIRLVDPRHYDFSKVEKGRRLLLDYMTEVNDTLLRPVPITARGVYIINFDTIRWLPKAQIQQLSPAGATVISQWVTGDFLNLQVRLDYDGQRCGFTIVGDRATKKSSLQQLYLCRTGAPATSPGVQRRTLGSFYCPELSTYELRPHPTKNVK